MLRGLQMVWDFAVQFGLLEVSREFGNMVSRDHIGVV